MSVSLKGKHVLITGGLGFLGSNLAHRLVADGAKVTLVDNLLAGHGGDWLNIQGLENQVKTVISDIRDASGMEALVKDAEVIFHIAGQTSHVDSMDNPLLDVDINCRGNIVVLEAVRRFAPEALVVYCSTRAVYGRPSESPAHEDILIRPVDIYGVNKYAGEAYHLLYHRKWGLKTVVLRVSNTYGPRAQIKAPTFGILNWMAGQALQGKKLRIFGDGAQLRDYTYVDDTLDAFLLAATKPEAVGQVFNVSAEQPVSFKNMVLTVLDLAQKLTGQNPGYEHVEWPADRKVIEVGDFVAASGKIRSLLGWSPRVDLKAGLKETMAFYLPLMAAYLAPADGA